MIKLVGKRCTDTYKCCLMVLALALVLLFLFTWILGSGRAHDSSTINPCCSLDNSRVENAQQTGHEVLLSGDDHLGGQYTSVLLESKRGKRRRGVMRESKEGITSSLHTLSTEECLVMFLVPLPCMTQYSLQVYLQLESENEYSILFGDNRTAHLGRRE